MSFELIGLGRLLSTMYAAKAQRISVLRNDIRQEIKKADGYRSSGGDFYGPFWADAKRHVSGDLDLRHATPNRIAGNAGRSRLYPALTQGFLQWWEEKRRLRNEPFSIINDNLKARYRVDSLGTIKVENLLAITISDDGHRVIYPYFSEKTPLGSKSARVGLWVMSQCIDRYALKDMRILDVFQGRSFSEQDTPLVGDERDTLFKDYSDLLDEWRELREKYVIAGKTSDGVQVIRSPVKPQHFTSKEISETIETIRAGSKKN